MIKVLAMVVPGCQKKDATTGNVVGVSQVVCGDLYISEYCKSGCKNIFVVDTSKEKNS